MIFQPVKDRALAYLLYTHDIKIGLSDKSEQVQKTIFNVLTSVHADKKLVSESVGVDLIRPEAKGFGIAYPLKYPGPDFIQVHVQLQYLEGL